MESRRKYKKSSVIKIAGAFIVWVIGSGFATGQEILQFFTSYGYWSYGIILVNMAGFLFLGRVLLKIGYDHRADDSFNHFKYFCGEKLGTFYTWLIPIILLSVMPVLISGAGATLNEYYGVKHWLGSAIMTGLVLIAYLIGFERLMKIVSTLGSSIIVFILVVGAISMIQNWGDFEDAAGYEELLGASQASPHWFFSAILYLSLIFISGSTYFSKIGMTAKKRQEAIYGASIGSVAVILTIAIINTAMILSAKQIATLSIPVLYLAKSISRVLGSVFSIFLILGMFSSCSAMMWTVCNRFSFGGKRGNQLFAVLVAVFVFVMGLLPFSDLVATLYPLVGYAGLVFLLCVLVKTFQSGYEKFRRKKQADS